MITIRATIARADEQTVNRFSGVATSQVVDAMDRLGGMSGQIQPIVCDRPFAGPALPVAAGPRDVLAIYAALTVARPGDVLVVSTADFSGSAVLGGFMAGLMRNAGIAGFVTDGMVRDRIGLASAGLPVFARGVTPNAPLKRGPGSVGLPVVLGGVAVAAGDIVLGDGDGVAVVPSNRIAEVIEALPGIRQREVDLDNIVKAGTAVPAWLEEALSTAGTVYVD